MLHIICAVEATAEMTLILAFWEGNEMDFELKKLLHDEMGMVRIDLSDKIDEFWLSNISIKTKEFSRSCHNELVNLNSSIRVKVSKLHV